MARTNAVMERTTTDGGNVVQWIAKDKSRTVSLDLRKLSPAMRARLLLHGAYAKGGDAAAMSNATMTKKLDSIQAVVDNLYAGQWSSTREAYSSLVDAIFEAHPKKNREKIAAAVRAMSAGERTALQNDPAIKTILDRDTAKAAKAAKIDAGKLLASI